jgi:hypothetical protein
MPSNTVAMLLTSPGARCTRNDGESLRNTSYAVHTSCSVTVTDLPFGT